METERNRQTFIKKKLFLALAFFLVFGGGIWLGLYIRSQTINPQATLPNVFERILTFFVRQGEKEDDDLLYHNVGLVDFIANGSTKTKVAGGKLPCGYGRCGRKSQRNLSKI